MILNVETLTLAVHPPAVIGAALKILQVGGSSLADDQMRRVVGSAYLFKTYREEIMGLVREMEASVAP